MDELERVSRAGAVLYESLEKARVTMDSADGLVSVTVGGRGEVIDLELDPRIYQVPNADELAKTIVETIRAGYEAATDESLQALEKLGRESDSALRPLIDSMRENWGVVEENGR
jgi:DNA-binding protein YbaB